jgi:hypothetical protein
VSRLGNNTQQIYRIGCRVVIELIRGPRNEEVRGTDCLVCRNDKVGNR